MNSKKRLSYPDGDIFLRLQIKKQRLNRDAAHTPLLPPNLQYLFQTKPLCSILSSALQTGTRI